MKIRIQLDGEGETIHEATLDAMLHGVVVIGGCHAPTSEAVLTRAVADVRDYLRGDYEQVVIDADPRELRVKTSSASSSPAPSSASSSPAPSSASSEPASSSASSEPASSSASPENPKG
jgi:hypothetical protein